VTEFRPSDTHPQNWTSDFYGLRVTRFTTPITMPAVPGNTALGVGAGKVEVGINLHTGPGEYRFEGVTGQAQ